MTFRGTPGDSYRPSNGTEGDMFMSAFCWRCIHDNPETEEWCEILTRTTVFERGHELYPTEWVYDHDGRPTCTAFVERGDGEHDGEPAPDPQSTHGPMIMRIRKAAGVER